MIVNISDDFSLPLIAESGQCFRVKNLPGDIYRFIFQSHVLYISQLSSHKYEVSCSEQEWNSIWYSYFDLSVNYSSIRASIPSDDYHLRSAAQLGSGIRILRQDPWEMLLTFIISQRKNIPAIRTSVELLAEKFGSPIPGEKDRLFSFPSPEQLSGADETALSSCKLGYRVPYVQDAVQKQLSGQMNLYSMSTLCDQALFDTLKTVKGVGDKVSGCICLFAYHRTSIAPVDVWIQRVIDTCYQGNNPFSRYKENAGIMQQYLFYYAQAKKMIR